MSKQGMMERLDWYIILRRIFNTIKDSETVQKPKLLQTLAENYLSLHLKPARDYLESTLIRGFSYDDVWTIIESLPRTFTWDDLLNSLSTMSPSPKCISPQSAPLPSKSTKPPKEEKVTDATTLKEDFPLIKFYNLTEIVMNRSLKFLSLGGNLITNANFEFPSTLIVLNLSYNQISDFSPVRPLVNMKFLNLSHNIIENLQDITGIITIQELFISENKLSQANFLFSIKNLTLLDLGGNNIENFEDIALLCTSSKLQMLNLSKNPLGQKPGYQTSVKNVVPSLMYFDPEDCSLFSSFKHVGFSVPRQESSAKQEKNVLAHVSVMNLDYPGKGKFSAEKVSPMINRAASPKTVASSPARHRRSKSNMPNGASPSNFHGTKFEAWNKYKGTEKGSARLRLKEFGDPISAMMIGPPAISNMFKQKRSKTMKPDIVGGVY